jgi:FixJ family two-component response regulator
MDNFMIAIIDDDAFVRESVRRLINSMNFKAEQFSSPDELLRSEHLQHVQCVICDVQIAGDSTEPFLNHLTAIGCDIPVIFMTALNDRAKEEQLLAAGAIGVMIKPFHQTEIADCIALALGRRDTQAGACSRPQAATTTYRQTIVKRRGSS